MNLIVSCPRHFETETIQEIKGILAEVGDENPKVTITNISGLLAVETSVEPLDVTKRIREKIEDEPWSIRYILRVIPIQVSIETTPEGIVEETLKLAKKIKEDQTYRITIEKRNSNISKSELISKIADGISRKVSLEQYDWIVLVEILGNKTGLSVLAGKDILSIEIAKRELSE